MKLFSELEKETLSHDELLLMKTQDIRYVLNKAQSEVKVFDYHRLSVFSLQQLTFPSPHELES